MGKYRSSPLGRRKISERNRGMELLCAIARPPQERWSIRERINFKIALGRFGQDWPRVAQFISSKTTDQLRKGDQATSNEKCYPKIAQKANVH
ncbi:hypothetical protein EJB05_56403, partial [Eragrostis curvula]